MVVTLDDVLQVNKEYRFTFNIKKKYILFSAYDTFIKYTQSPKIGMPNNLKKGKKHNMLGYEEDMSCLCLMNINLTFSILEQDIS